MAGAWGFSGETYSGPLTSDRSQNLFPEFMEGHRTASAESKFSLMGRPGKRLFATLPTSPGRGLLAAHGFLYAVGGGVLYTVEDDGNVTDAGGGAIEDGDEPVQMFATTDDILLYDGNGNIWWRHGGFMTKVLEDAQALTIADSYGVALRSNTGSFAFGKQINISSPLVYTEWGELDFQIKVTSTDTLKNIFWDHALIALFGLRTVEIWINTGAEFPFERYPEGFMDQGLWAKYSVAKLDESIFWLGGDDRGIGQVWRSNGQTPQRISNHALERAIRGYAIAGEETSDAIAYTYQESGHSFYVLHFPTADATWVYDTTTKMWHERGYWDGETLHQDFGRFHAHAYGKHFVQDYRNGKIYEASEDIFDDDGEPILWRRRAPVISKDEEWVRYNSLQVSKLVSTTPETLTLRYSNDGGKTFGADRTAVVQQIADKEDGRAMFRQLGRSRKRVFEVESTAAVRQAWSDAFLKMAAGNGT